MIDPSQLGPGKIAPRLIEDLLSFDPRHLPLSSIRGYNPLRHQPPQFHDAPTYQLQIPPTACRHLFVVKSDQSRLRQDTSTPDHSSSFKVAAYCPKCRLHADLFVDFRSPQDPTCRPCPFSDGIIPVHHLCYQLSRAIPNKFTGQCDDEYVYQCSSTVCPARVSVTIKKPRLSDGCLKLLTDPELILKRDRLARTEFADRFVGFPIPSGSNVLHNLSRYLNDMLNPSVSTGKNKVSVINKHYLSCFGEDGSAVLRYLGWHKVTEPGPQGESQTFWKIPTVESHRGPDELNEFRSYIEDFYEEVKSLFFAQPDQSKLSIDSNIKNPQTYRQAVSEFKLCLSCNDFDIEGTTRAIDPSRPDHPYYASLGIMQYVKDDIVEFAYLRQRATDPSNAPYYLDCLTGLADGRKSDMLMLKSGTFRSQGEVGLKDIVDAYNYFGLDRSLASLDDETIINTFRARLEDSSRSQEVDLRQSLTLIGRDRNSSTILSFASKSIETIEDALAFLDAEKDTPDEFVLVLATSKISDHPEETEKVRSAIEIVAKVRNSSSLHTWLETGHVEPMEMDAQTAYSRLGMDDQSLDDATVISLFEMRVEDYPGSVEELRSALQAIGKDRSSSTIESYLRHGKQVPSQDRTGSNTVPVGLENIGNTCYLNSLLQYLFSIRPLRENLLESYESMKIDADLLDVENDGRSSKRILSTRVTRRQIRLAQDFVEELQRLFQHLIKTPQSSITPTHQLAIRTLMPLDDGRTRRMTLSGPDERPTYGPQLPPQESMQTTAESQGLAGFSTAGDASSEGTLVDKSDENSIIMDDETRLVQQDILDNKENHAPTKGDMPQIETASQAGAPLNEATASKLNQKPLSNGDAHSPPLSPSHEMDIDPPERPPPVPPRPNQLDKSKALNEDELSRQQDVAEVFGNVLLQLECAIKPEKLDKRSEQLDYVKTLFYGKTKSVTIDRKGESREIEEWFSDIKVNATDGPADIYSALDGAFDEQQVSVDDQVVPQYTSISQLPQVLQIFIQRSHWNQESKAQYKDESHIAMRNIIHLDRYLDPAISGGADELMKRRAESWKLKKRLAGLRQQKRRLEKTELENTSVPDALNGTLEFLEKYKSLDIDDEIIVQPSVAETIKKASEHARKEIEAIEQTIERTTQKLSVMFDGLKTFPYRLHAVFMHRGSSSFGHYWLHMYDALSGVWRKYNDADVSIVSESLVYDPPDPSSQGPKATPYFLVYVRDDIRHELAQPLCRDIELPPPPEEEDLLLPDTDDVWEDSDPPVNSSKENPNQYFESAWNTEDPVVGSSSDKGKGREFDLGG